jgi:DNA replication protein DnaC
MKHKVEVIPKEEILANRCNAYEFIDFDKKETLEEAFDRIFDSLDYILFDFCSFEQGAKWQQEQIYNLIKQLYENEEITGFSKRACAQCLDIVESFKNK